MSPRSPRPGRSGAFPVDPEDLAQMLFASDVVVVARHEGRRVGRERQRVGHDLAHRIDHGPSAGLGVVERPLEVAQVVPSLGALDIEVPQTLPAFRAASEMVITNGLADAPRAAVQHQPEASLLVGLQLHEVVASAQGSELKEGVTLLRGLQRGAAQTALAQLSRHDPTPDLDGGSGLESSRRDQPARRPRGARPRGPQPRPGSAGPRRRSLCPLLPRSDRGCGRSPPPCRHTRPPRGARRASPPPAGRPRCAQRARARLRPRGRGAPPANETLRLLAGHS